jgi:hypothetical protein
MATITLKLSVDRGATFTLFSFEAEGEQLGSWGIHRELDPEAWRRGEYVLTAEVGTFTPRPR